MIVTKAGQTETVEAPEPRVQGCATRSCANWNGHLCLCSALRIKPVPYEDLRT